MYDSGQIDYDGDQGQGFGGMGGGIDPNEIFSMFFGGGMGGMGGMGDMGGFTRGSQKGGRGASNFTFRFGWFVINFIKYFTSWFTNISNNILSLIIFQIFDNVP